MRKIQLNTTVLIIVFISLVGCKVQGPYYRDSGSLRGFDYPEAKKSGFTLFLVGDAGDATKASAVFSHLKKDINRAGPNSAVVNLGDNAYPIGLPGRINKWRTKAGEALDTQIASFEDYKGNVFFIPGNHDWAKGRQEGYRYILNQERYLNEGFEKQVFFPQGGCPGPVELVLNDTLTLVLLDSQWYFQNHYKPSNEDNCGIEDEEDIFLQLRDILRRNKGKSVVVAAHHPLYSVGMHGGRFNPWLNIFPLTVLHDNLFIPLPGFIYTAGRKYFGHIQDVAHPRYKQYIKSVTDVLEEFPNVVFAAGHEHNLQYTQKEGVHHIISGSASKISDIIHNKDAEFAFSSLGYARLDYLTNGEVWLKYKAIDTTGVSKIIFAKKVFTYQKPENRVPEAEKAGRFPDSIKMAPSTRYEAGKFKMFMLGENYRNVWSRPINVEVFDIGSEKGGLEIVKRGGGMQTLSVRLEAKDKKQYVLRSLDKHADRTVPESLEETFAVKLVQDNISATFPYGALVAAALEEKTGLYHTNPKVVYVPDDPRLGIYRKELAGKLFLFEERPDEDWSNADFFGNSENIKSTRSTIEDIIEDNELIIDQPFVLKNRLFDMFINDWDRHDDQWRWAPIDKDGETIYRPIPRDRDNAMFLNEGVVPCIAKRQWAVWRLQGLNDPDPDVRGLNFNARHFDRTFLNEMTLDDWMKAARELQEQLSDENIETALQELPDPIYALTGNRLKALLETRRNNLVALAETYYKVLAKEVDVFGSEDDEYFEVTRMVDGTTLVSVYDIKDGDKKALQLYCREFYPDETEELRLYGIDDDDVYLVKGSGNKGIKVRIVAGKDDDEISDVSAVKGLGKHTIVYDNSRKADLPFGSETKFRRIKSDDAHAYHRKAFEYDVTAPALFFGYNAEDGVFVGGGAETTRHGFRKEPFSSRHILTANYSAMTDAFNFQHRSIFTDAFGTWDLLLRTDIYGPNYTSNYFGYGNDSELGDFKGNKSYYYVRREQVTFSPSFRQRFNNSDLTLGAFVETSKIKNNEARYITQFNENGLSENILDRKTYAGLKASFSYDSRNDKLFPTAGIHWENEAAWYLGANADSENFNKFRSDFRSFLSRKINPRYVLALRFGGELITGNPGFIHTSALGGKTNLRGYPVTRFYGDASVFQNTDLRIKLADIHSFYLSGQFGIFGFHDVGRVWQNDEKSLLWHNGYGAGIWFSPFGMAVLTAHYAASDEYSIVRVKFDFHF